MKVFFTVCFLLAVTVAAAFDSEAWLRKREALTHEADRLRAEYARCAASDMPAAENVVIPVESYGDGSLKLVVEAQKARYFATDGLVWAEGVAVRKFDADGVLDSQIDARHCVIDRNSKSGWAEGGARLVRGKTVCFGEGVYFSASNGYVKVFKNADIVSKDLKFGGLKP